MSASVTIVSVAFNSDAVLPGMCDSIPKGTPIVIVDNGSSAPVTLTGPDIQIIRNEKNEGFGRACNRGAAAAQTDFILFLNPDARLSDGAIDAFLASASAQPDASGWNPRFIDGKGGTYFKRRSKLTSDAATPLPPAGQDAKVATLHGACIFVSKALFDQVGGFDPNIFLYHEDDDLSVRLSQHGRLMLCDAAHVTHFEGRSSARTPQTAAFKAFHMARSRTYAHAKHGHAGAKWATLREGILGLLSPLNLLSARKRAKAVGFVKGALSALKDGGAYEG